MSDMKVVPCTDSKFVCLSRVEFNQNGKQRKWDYVRVHDSVAILLFNTTRQAFILVKQFRPAVYMHHNDHENKQHFTTHHITSQPLDTPITASFEKGVTYEMCAGIIDQSRSEVEIAKSEVLEECGYDVPIEKFERIFSNQAVGFSGNKSVKFFAEVNDSMIVSQGGGNRHEGEYIEVFYLPLADAKSFVFDESISKPAGLIASFCWYFWKKKIM